MKLLYLSLAFGALVAAFVAWRLAVSMGDPVGAGALFGALSGLGLGAGGILWQRHLLASGESRRAMTVFAIAFLVKLVFVLGVALALRYGGYELLDWTAFLVAFPIAVMWTTCTGWIGAFPNMRQNHSGAH
jgi:hypothetical protein